MHHMPPVFDEDGKPVKPGNTPPIFIILIAITVLAFVLMTMNNIPIAAALVVLAIGVVGSLIATVFVSCYDGGRLRNWPFPWFMK